MPVKKILAILIASTMLLTACGGKASSRSYSSVSSSTSDDTVLWINEDGTDCDLGDFLEGDKDCKKTKKTVYYSTPKQSVVSKLRAKASTVKSNVTQKVDTVKKKTTTINPKKKIDATKKPSSTFQKRSKSSSSWSRSSTSKSSSTSRRR
jgi:hypothetical protein